MDFNFELELPIIDKNCPLYIRFGEIPEDEKSFIQYRSYDCGYEEGVSVYNCVLINGLPHLVMPYPYAEGIAHTLWDLLEYNKRNVYLVTGKQVGVGCDNEPLITNVRIIQDITEVWLEDIKNHKHARHEMLLKRAEQNGFAHN